MSLRAYLQGSEEPNIPDFNSPLRGSYQEPKSGLRGYLAQVRSEAESDIDVSQPEPPSFLDKIGQEIGKRIEPFEKGAQLIKQSPIGQALSAGRNLGPLNQAFQIGLDTLDPETRQVPTVPLRSVLDIVRPKEEDPTGTSIGAKAGRTYLGTVRGAADVIEMLTTSENISIMALMKALGGLPLTGTAIDKVIKYGPAAADLGFFGIAAKEAPEIWEEYKKVKADPNSTEADIAEATTRLAGFAALGILGLYGGAKEVKRIRTTEKEVGRLRAKEKEASDAAVKEELARLKKQQEPSAFVVSEEGTAVRTPKSSIAEQVKQDKAQVDRLKQLSSLDYFAKQVNEKASKFDDLAPNEKREAVKLYRAAQPEAAKIRENLKQRRSQRAAGQEELAEAAKIAEEIKPAKPVEAAPKPIQPKTTPDESFEEIFPEQKAERLAQERADAKLAEIFPEEFGKTETKPIAPEQLKAPELVTPKSAETPAAQPAKAETEKVPEPVAPPVAEPKPPRPNEQAPANAATFGQALDDFNALSESLKGKSPSEQMAIAKARLEEKGYHPAIVDELTNPDRFTRPDLDGDIHEATTRPGRLQRAVEPPRALKPLVDNVAKTNTVFRNAEAAYLAVRKAIISKIEALGGEVIVKSDDGTFSIKFREGKPKLSEADQALVNRLKQEAADAGAYSLKSIGKGFEIASAPLKIADPAALPDDLRGLLIEYIKRKREFNQTKKAYDAAKWKALKPLTDHYFAQKAADEKGASLIGHSDVPVEIQLRRKASDTMPDTDLINPATGETYFKGIVKARSEGKKRSKAVGPRGEPFVKPTKISEPIAGQRRAEGKPFFDIRSHLDEADQKALDAVYERGKERLSKTSGRIDAGLLDIGSWKDLAETGYYVSKALSRAAKGKTVDFAQWSAEMVKNFGEKIKPLLKDLWNDLKLGFEPGEIKIKSKEFKQWFGDWENNPGSASKVVGSDGKPMIMYHGTRSDFEIFDPALAGSNYKGTPFEQKGIYFTSSPESAREWGLKALGKDKPVRVIAAYLNIKKPYGKTRKEILSDDATPEIFRKKGYDGMFHDEYNSPEFDAVVLNPEQIKIIGNVPNAGKKIQPNIINNWWNDSEYLNEYSYKYDLKNDRMPLVRGVENAIKKGENVPVEIKNLFTTEERKIAREYIDSLHKFDIRSSLSEAENAALDAALSRANEKVKAAYGGLWGPANPAIVKDWAEIAYILSKGAARKMSLPDFERLLKSGVSEGVFKQMQPHLKNMLDTFNKLPDWKPGQDFPIASLGFVQETEDKSKKAQNLWDRAVENLDEKTQALHKPILDILAHQNKTGAKVSQAWRQTYDVRDNLRAKYAKDITEFEKKVARFRGKKMPHLHSAYQISENGNWFSMLERVLEGKSVIDESRFTPEEKELISLYKKIKEDRDAQIEKLYAAAKEKELRAQRESTGQRDLFPEQLEDSLPADFELFIKHKGFQPTLNNFAREALWVDKSGPLYDAIVDALLVENKHKFKTREEVIKKINGHKLSAFDNVPTHVKVGRDLVPIGAGDAVSALKAMDYETARLIAAMKTFGTKYAKSLAELRKEMIAEGRPGDKVLDTDSFDQARDAYWGLYNRSGFIKWLEGRNPFARALNSLILPVGQAAALTGSAAVQLAQPFLSTTNVGMKNWLRAYRQAIPFVNLSKSTAEAQLLTAMPRLVRNYAFGDRRVPEDLGRISSEFLTGATGFQSMVRFNDTVATQAYRFWARELMDKVKSGKGLSEGDVMGLKSLNLSDAQINMVKKGLMEEPAGAPTKVGEELFANIVRRGREAEQFTGVGGAKKTRFQQSRTLSNVIFPFTGYAVGSFNRWRREYENLRGAIHSGDKHKIAAAARRAAMLVGTTTLAGDLTAAIRHTMKGDTLEDIADDSAVVQLANGNMARSGERFFADLAEAGFIGPAQRAWNNFEYANNPAEALASQGWLTNQAYEALKVYYDYGEYADKTKREKAFEFFRGSTPIVDKLPSALKRSISLMGIEDFPEFEIRSASRKFREWQEDNDLKKQYFPLEGFEADRRALRKAYEAIKSGNDEELNERLAEAFDEKKKKVLSEGKRMSPGRVDREAISRMKQSMGNRLFLIKPSEGKYKEKYTAAQIESLKKQIGEDRFKTLEMHDLLIKNLIDSLKPFKFRQ